MKSWIGRGAAALCVITPFAIARAQDAPPSDEDVIAEIIVTAQKRATALQDVPFSSPRPAKPRSAIPAPPTSSSCRATSPA